MYRIIVHIQHPVTSLFARLIRDCSFTATAEHSKNFVRAILRLKKSFERRVTLSKPSKKQGGFEFNTPVIEVERSFIFYFYFSMHRYAAGTYTK